MTPRDAAGLSVEERAPAPETPPATPPQRHRLRNVLVGSGIAVLVLVSVALAVVWFGREDAQQLSDDQALNDFRSEGSAASDPAGGPLSGVYAATASGTESIGLPGFDEQLGPNAPVTVTHQDDGCFVYRADFNSHHWRSWTFCPHESATSSLTRTDSFTARKAPGLDVESITTYTCDRPLDFLWSDPGVGDERSSACTGTTDLDDSVTADEGVAEVLDVGSTEVDGETVETIHLRTTDTFGQAQSGYETAEWWLDAGTGLPLKVVLESDLSGGPSDYAERWELELTTLDPQT